MLQSAVPRKMLKNFKFEHAFDVHQIASIHGGHKFKKINRICFFCFRNSTTAYLVPVKCWNEEHFPRLKNSLLTNQLLSIWWVGKEREFDRVDIVKVHSTLYGFPIGTKRVGVERLQVVMTEQPHPLPTADYHQEVVIWI